jgi:hypothetical protein
MRLFTVSALLCLTSCARNGSGSATVDQPSESSTSVPAITLERTACFGSCAVYSISVSPLGEIRYQGKANVRKVGPASAKIPVERVNALLYELDNGGYFSFADRYTSPEPSCGRYATDSPTTITSVTLRGHTKRIIHDYGCGGAPGALVVLERRIDEALNSGQWTGR